MRCLSLRPAGSRSRRLKVCPSHLAIITIHVIQLPVYLHVSVAGGEACLLPTLLCVGNTRMHGSYEETLIHGASEVDVQRHSGLLQRSGTMPANALPPRSGLRVYAGVSVGLSNGPFRRRTGRFERVPGTSNAAPHPHSIAWLALSDPE